MNFPARFPASHVLGMVALGFLATLPGRAQTAPVQSPTVLAAVAAGAAAAVRARLISVEESVHGTRSSSCYDDEEQQRGPAPCGRHGPPHKRPLRAAPARGVSHAHEKGREGNCV